MKQSPLNHNGKSQRTGMFIPLVLMVASIVSCCISCSDARHNLREDLNDAMIALVNENSEIWTRQDTIAALRKMHETTHRPVIYQAYDLNFRNKALKDEAYFTLALVDRNNAAPERLGHRIASDSIMLVPESAADGLAVQVQGFADCSMASVFAASDQTLPGILFTLSILSMASMVRRRRKDLLMQESAPAAVHPLEGIKLTPMQRQFAQLLLDAPGMRVDKATICSTLWGNKSNAEESLYTLVRRTKTALSAADIEIICNRGDSYELRISD